MAPCETHFKIEKYGFIIKILCTRIKILPQHGIIENIENRLGDFLLIFFFHSEITSIHNQLDI